MKKSKYLLFILVLLLYGCEKEVPTLTTSAISAITPTSANSGGNITDDGNASVTAYGVCWNTSAGPTTADSKTMDGSGSDSFTSSLTGLSQGETYYVRAWATNSEGTGYGDELSFTTKGFTKKSGNPVMTPGSSTSWDKETIGFGSVIYYNNKYHMWYTGGSTSDLLYRWRIGHATSDDGITWIKDPNNPVLVEGPSGSWEEHFVHNPKVMVINNTFHMWYTGHKNKYSKGNFKIGHATSTDGSNWTKDSNNPVLTTGTAGTWENSWICIGDVLDAGTKYHLWYSGADTLSGWVKIGHATSTDGLTWTKDPANPVLVAEGSGSWEYQRVELPSVLFDGAVYHMWYSAGISQLRWKIGHATSANGFIWTKDPLNPVLIPGPTGAWDSYSVAGMSVLSSGGKYKMWYFGSKLNVATCIGYAEKEGD